MLVQQAREQIQGLRHPEIRDLLLQQLNPHAKILTDLFYPPDCPPLQKGEEEAQKVEEEWVVGRSFSMFTADWAANKGYREQSAEICSTQSLPHEVDIIGLALSLGPQQFRTTLTSALLSLDEASAVELLESEGYGYKAFFALFDHSTLENCNRVAAWLKSCNPKHIGRLLNHCNFPAAILRTDDKTSEDLLKALSLLSSEEIKQAFKTYLGIDKPNPRDPKKWADYHDLANLFRTRQLSTPKALALLATLEKLNQDDLLTLFSKSAISSFGYTESKKILHLILSDYPIEVVEKCLGLLDRLANREFAFLISATTADNKTPLHYAFSGDQAITALVIKAWKAKPFFNDFLLKSPSWFGSDDSPMNTAIQFDNQVAITYLLTTQPLSREQYRSLYQQADTYKQTTVLDLLAAFPLYKQITSPLKQAQKDLNHFIPQIKKQPNSVNTCWTNQETLLHLAAKQGDSQSLSFLLEQGANVNARDASQFAAIDIALEHSHFDAVLCLLQHPQIILHQADGQGRYPLAKILASKHWELAKSLVLSLEKAQHGATHQAFAIALEQLPYHYQLYDDLKVLLDEAKPEQALSNRFQNYCETKKDGFSLMLIEAGKRLGQAPTLLLSKAAKGFVQKQLTALSKANELKKDSLRHQLLLFLFAIPAPSLISFLATLSLNPKRQVQLRLLLSYALIKPAIFSQLPPLMHGQLLNYLAKDRTLFTNLITLHFQGSDLTLLPLAILTYFSKHLSFAELIKQNASRLHPTLLLLTLEKALNEKQAEANLQSLFKQLEGELTLFNQIKSPLTEAQLQQMLALATTAEVKARVHQWLDTLSPEARLKQRIQNLLLAFKKKDELPKHSFLRELFISLLKQRTTFTKPEQAKAAETVLALASPEEITAILDSYAQTLEPYRVVASLLSAKEPTEQTNHSSFLLPKWLLHLDQSYEITDQRTEQALYSFTPAIKKELAALSASLSRGIYKNPAFVKLALDFIPWQRKHQALFPSADLFTTLLPLLQKADEATRATLILQQQTLLEQAEGLRSLMDALSQLSEQQLSIDELIDLLIKTDQSLLRQFASFAKEAERHDLHRLCRYVLTGLEQNCCHFLLQTFEINAKVKHVSSWLRKSLEALSTYTRSALSLKVLLESIPFDEDSVLDQLETLIKTVKSQKIRLLPKAIQTLMLAYQPLLRSPLALTVAAAFSELLQLLNARMKAKLLADLPKEMTDLLLEQSLKNLYNPNQEFAASSKILLSNLCHYSGLNNEEQLTYIKQRLARQDIELLGNKEVAALAQSLLSTKENLQDLSCDGVWIQRLLLTPSFIAAIEPDALEALVERYRALSLTLKQDEFERLTSIITGKFNFADMQHKNFLSYQKALLANPKKKAELLAKRDRLLKFRSNNALGALFNQLEDNCLALQTTNKELADKALSTLYHYHYRQLQNHRKSGLYCLAHFIYAKASRDQGDLAKAQSLLLSWLERYLPHQNFHQAELIRKNQVLLYNEKGEQMGFLDEANQAFAFINEEPIPLIEVRGIKAGLILYDNQRQRLGELTSSSQLHRENLFQQQTAALLLSKIPIKELEKSAAALELLLQDLIHEKAINLVFCYSETEEKQQWLQQKLMKYLQTLETPLAKEALETIIAHYSFDTLSANLLNFKNPLLAQQLFTALLADQKQRTAFFNQQDYSLFNRFLESVNAKEALAEFLLHHHDKPWFAKGLAAFTQFTLSKPELLGDALGALSYRVGMHQLEIERLDGILTSLLSNNNIASLVLQGLADAPEKPVQQANTAEIAHFAQHFDKSHLIESIAALNKESSWSNNNQYRLILTLFNTDPEQFFPAEELRFSAKFAWQAEDLKTMAYFLSRHRQLGDFHDKHFDLAERLYGELAFRFANYGEASFFYTSTGRLDPDLARFTLKRSLLQTLASRLYPVNKAKEAIEGAFSFLKNWFLSPEELQTKETKALLAEQKALLDWKKLAHESWVLTNDSTLPIPVTFLMNYCGTTAAILPLIRDLATHPSFVQQGSLHYLAKIMGHYSDRDISHLIFAIFEQLATQNPALLDRMTLASMAQFHIKTHLKSKDSPNTPPAEIALLSHFGQQKKYALIKHCCQLLLDQDLTKPWTDLIKQAATEAQIEASIDSGSTNWFYKLLVSIKRWWYYGFGSKQNLSELVKFCDDDKPYDDPKQTLEQINTEALPGQTFTAKLVKVNQLKSLRRRYQQFLVTEKTMDPPVEPLPLSAKDLAARGFFASNETLPTDQRTKTTLSNPLNEVGERQTINI